MEYILLGVSAAGLYFFAQYKKPKPVASPQNWHRTLPIEPQKHLDYRAKAERDLHGFEDNFPYFPAGNKTITAAQFKQQQQQWH